MQHYEVGKSKDVPPSHPQGSQEEARFTNFYRPEASQPGRQEASSSERHGALLKAQELFRTASLETQRTDLYRPEANQVVHNEAELKRLERLREVQKQFEPEAASEEQKK